MSEEIMEVEVQVEEKAPSRVLKVISGVGEAYKFAWFACLGTALTAEEKLVSFSKKMAAKGKVVDVNPKSILLKKLDAPKAKLTIATEELKIKAQDKISGVEVALDKGVNRSLHLIGVPSRKDMDQMTSMMKDMADSITELSTMLQESKGAAARSAPTSAKKPKADEQTSAA